MCKDEFQNVQYVSVEQRRFQDIRIEFLTTTKVVLHFRKNYKVVIYIKHGVGIHNGTYITMHPLEMYYFNQASRGLSPTPGIGPIYSAPLYL